MTTCCTPHTAKFAHVKDWQVHSAGCLSGYAGLPYHGNVEPDPDKPERVSGDDYWKAKVDRKRARQPRRTCTGYQHTCPWRGCHHCLGVNA